MFSARRLVWGIACFAVIPVWSGCAADTLRSRGARGGAGAIAESDGVEGLVVDTGSTLAVTQTANATIRGRVLASDPPVAVQVQGKPAQVSENLTFEANVEVPEGLTLVEVSAADSLGRVRAGHRSILRAPRFLEEGEVEPRAAEVQLTQSFIDAMLAPYASAVASLDVATPIRRQDPLIRQGSCVIRPTHASHDPARAIGVIENGQLWLEVQIDNLEVQFRGQNCARALFGLVNPGVRGSLNTHVRIRTRLSVDPSETCARGIQYSPPLVSFPGFRTDIQGTGFFGFLVSLFGGGALSSPDSFAAEFSALADQVFDALFSDNPLFDASGEMPLMGKPVTLRLCTTGLISRGGQLFATMGGASQSPGRTEGAGAPMQDGQIPPATPDSWVLDANLIGQLFYSVWRSGGLYLPNAIQLMPEHLAVLGRKFVDRLGNEEVWVTIDTQLTPFVHTDVPNPPLEGVAPEDQPHPDDIDLVVELGNVVLSVTSADRLVFRLGTQIKLLLSLLPVDGALQPKVLASTFRSWVLEEAVADAEDAQLLDLLDSLGKAQINRIFEANRFALPSLPGTGSPIDVRRDPAGRYLRIYTQP